jgi:hypothetical protein
MDDACKMLRRHDHQAAQVVQSGVMIQFLAGTLEAECYLLDKGIPVHVVERVLSETGAPRRSDVGT